ncbi:hypothetical protein [Pectobacterium versatile]|uniref:hypothetical protein n=1 Tax=Pectobacterium versatile TaxID=2488639 RepID=UPI001F1C745A|nr:hypothetical protein [Pectobacterium versatile]
MQILPAIAALQWRMDSDGQWSAQDRKTNLSLAIEVLPDGRMTWVKRGECWRNGFMMG